MLKLRKGEFDRKVCISTVGLCNSKGIITDTVIHKEGEKCFEEALENLKSAYPNVTSITKKEFGKYSRIFAVRGFAGRGKPIKMYHGNLETSTRYYILFGTEIYEKIGNWWYTMELGNPKRYKDSDCTIPKVGFDYAPTGNKCDDAYFENPLSEYVEYFGIN